MLISNTPQFLTESEVARLVSMSLATVRRWRLLQTGPRFVKLGAAVRYRPEDVSAWLESRPTGGGNGSGSFGVADGL